MAPTSRILAVESRVNNQILAQEKALINETSEQTQPHPEVLGQETLQQEHQEKRL